MDLRERVLGARPELEDPLLRRAFANLTSMVASATTRHVGRYRLIRRLGAGGFGTVWLALDPALSRQVAIKVLHRDLGDQQLLHLRREAQTLAALSHPNVVMCFDVGVDDDMPYMALQFVDGCDLAEWIEQPRAPREILRVFAEAGAGIAAAHAVGIVHRDVKPANILLARHGPAMVTDFGVARAWADAITLGSDDDDAAATAVAGTPMYMPPEQMLGRPATPAADVYALAATLYQAFAGVLPFGGRNHHQLLEEKLAVRINPPARGRTVPSRVWDAVMAGVDPEPHHRPSVMGLVREASPRSWRVGRVVAAICVGTPVLAFAAVPPEHDPCAASAEAAPDDLDDAAQGRHRAIAQARQTACTAFAGGELARKELDERLACLERDDRDLSALVDALSDSNVVGADAAMAITGLPAPGRCVAEPANRDGDDPESARARLMLARAVSRRDSAAARAVATEVLAIAEADGRVALQAEALVQRGIASVTLLDGAPAIADLHRAFWLANGIGDDRIAAEAAVWLVGSVGRIHGPGEAEPWVRHAEASLDRLTGADSLRAWLELHRSSNAVAAGDLTEAAAAGDRMLAHWQRAAADDREALVHPWMQYASIMRVSARLDDALAAIAEAERRIVPEHDPGGALALQARTIAASVRFDRGDARGALEEFRALLPRLEQALGPDDARVVSTRTNLARLLVTTGQHVEARQQLAILLEQIERTLGRDHEYVARTLTDLGFVDHEYVARTLTDLGFVDLRRGDFDDAREHLLRAVVIFESRPVSPSSVTMYTALADLEAAQDDHEGALRWMERAQAVTDETHPPGHRRRVDIAVRVALARATARGGEANFAALEALRRELPNATLRAEIAIGAAAAFRTHGDFVAAERLDREAVAYFEQQGLRRELARASYSLANSLAGQEREAALVTTLRRDACAVLREPEWFDRHHDGECTRLGFPPSTPARP